MPAVRSLRPTPDRVRETVFNWLQPDIVDARCLDLFAGSGALGFEAVSRGAAHVVMVEITSRAAEHLQVWAARLDSTRIEVCHMGAERFLRNCSYAFDLVFVDPPYQAHLVTPVCQQLASAGVLKRGARVYVEWSKHMSSPALPCGWTQYRQGCAGDVAYALVDCDALGVTEENSECTPGRSR